MENELMRSAHTIGETNLHLQFTPAYRQNIFRNPLTRELTVAYLIQRSQELKVKISAVDCGPDHIHLFVENWKNYSVASLACELKKYASRQMRKGHKYLFEEKLWGAKFWSAGYFHRTVGVVTATTVKKYVTESQQKHWDHREQGYQQTLVSYAC